MGLQFIDFDNCVSDISDSTKCFDRLTGELFYIGSKIVDYIGVRIHDDTNILDISEILGRFYKMLDLSKVCAESYTEYEYNLSVYSEKCFMLDPNFSCQVTFDVKQIMECTYAMETMRFEPITRQLKLALHTPDVLQGQSEATLYTFDVPKDLIDL